jgi:hypothetical protein
MLTEGGGRPPSRFCWTQSNRWSGAAVPSETSSYGQLRRRPLLEFCWTQSNSRRGAAGTLWLTDWVCLALSSVGPSPTASGGLLEPLNKLTSGPSSFCWTQSNSRRGVASTLWLTGAQVSSGLCWTQSNRWRGRPSDPRPAPKAVRWVSLIPQSVGLGPTDGGGAVVRSEARCTR